MHILALRKNTMLSFLWKPPNMSLGNIRFTHKISVRYPCCHSHVFCGEQLFTQDPKQNIRMNQHKKSTEEFGPKLRPSENPVETNYFLQPLHNKLISAIIPLVLLQLFCHRLCAKWPLH